MRLQVRHTKTEKSFTEIFFESDLHRSIKEAKAELLEILKILKSGEAHFLYSGQVVSAKNCDFPRLLVEWSRKTKLDQQVKNIILSALLTAEEKCQASAILTAASWATGENFKSTFNEKRCNYNQIERLVFSLCGKGLSSNMTLASVRMGGLGCNVNFLETKNSQSFIKSCRGIEVDCQIDPLFGDRIGRHHKFSNCHIVAIDGIVESVSELHKILEFSEKSPIILFANGFLPDVSNTMAETSLQKRGTCVPVVVKNWPKKNFLDLETFGVGCVSPDRGDIVASLGLEKLKSHFFEIEENFCVLEFSNSTEANRIEFVISQSMGGLTGLAVDRVKSLLGFARLASRGGIASCQEFCGDSKILLECFSKDLVVPQQALANASLAKKSLEKILQELGCLITV